MISHGRFNSFLKEEGLLDDEGKTTALMHLDQLAIDTTKDDIDSEFIKTFYEAVSFIDVLALASDKAPKTFPPAEKMEKITELIIGVRCTSFVNENILEELKSLKNLEKIYVRAAVERMSHSSLRQLAKLNGTISTKFYPYEDAMAKHIIGALAEAQSDVEKAIPVVYGGDQLLVDRKNQKITFLLGLSRKTIHKDLISSAAGYTFSFEMISIIEEGGIYRNYLEYTKPRLIKLKSEICSEYTPPKITDEFAAVTKPELVNLMDDCTSSI